MTNRLAYAVALAVAMPLTGCASFSTLGLARTMNKGGIQGWVAPGGGGAVATAGGTSGGVGYPLLEGGVRYGVTDNVELGAKLGFDGLTLQSKFGLVRSPTMDKGFDLSIAPQVGFIGFGESASSGSTSSGSFVGVLTAQLPILVGIDFGGHELVLGPRVVDQVLFGDFGSSGGSSGSAVADLLYVGGSIGFAIRLSPYVRIMPEVAIGVPVYESVNDVGSSALGGLVFQGGIGFLFGSGDQYERPEPPPPPPVVAQPVAGPPPPPPNAAPPPPPPTEPPPPPPNQ